MTVSLDMDLMVTAADNPDQKTRPAARKCTRFGQNHFAISGAGEMDGVTRLVWQVGQVGAQAVFEYERILIPFDGSDLTERAITPAITIASADDRSHQAPCCEGSLLRLELFGNRNRSKKKVLSA
jgi:hypothetical protein